MRLSSSSHLQLAQCFAGRATCDSFIVVGALGVARGKRRRDLSRVICCRTSGVGVTLPVLASDEEVPAEELSDYLVSESGWNVRALEKNDLEIREVAKIQAEAFHTPMAFFDDLFFEFFKADVLSGLIYKLRHSPSGRYACLVAEEMAAAADPSVSSKLVGVVDATVLRDEEILRHLPEADEFLYISGIAVDKSFRRRKVASALLKACDVLSDRGRFEYLVLRAYENDVAAQALYFNAGYTIVAADPQWIQWFMRRRRVLMVRRKSI